MAQSPWLFFSAPREEMVFSPHVKFDADARLERRRRAAREALGDVQPKGRHEHRSERR